MGLTENTATALLALNDLDVLPHSAVSVEGTEAGLGGLGPKVEVLAPSGSQVLSGFEGESSATGGRTLLLGPMSAAYLDVLREFMPRLLREHPEHYAAGLQRHFLRHLEPFANGGPP